MNLTVEQELDLVKFLIHPDRKQKNILKVCEELAELQEVLLKYVNKKDELKPTTEKIVEEMGDVVFRMSILSEQLGIGDAIGERMNNKSSEVYEWYQEQINQLA